MGFHYSVEKRRFEQEWAKLRKEYIEAGMTEEAIQSLYEYDWNIFCSQRTYANHTQPLPIEYIGDNKSEYSTLFRKYISISITFDESDFSGQYAWVDAIENQRLALALRKLPEEDLELLSLLVLKEYTQKEIAEKLGCTQAAISKRFKKIKNFLRGWL